MFGNALGRRSSLEGVFVSPIEQIPLLFIKTCANHSVLFSETDSGLDSPPPLFPPRSVAAGTRAICFLGANTSEMRLGVISSVVDFRAMKNSDTGGGVVSATDSDVGAF